MDIYGKAEEVKDSFKEFANKVSDKLFVYEEAEVEGFSYGFSDESDCKVVNLNVKKGLNHFDLQLNGEKEKGFRFAMAGKHNVLNATAAILMAMEIGLESNQIKKALLDFPGVKRRFAIHNYKSGKVYIDDYAHHPTELKACISAARELYPNKNILGVFQPHLFSRTRDFVTDFARELAQLDELILLPIYPAREKPIAGVDSEWLLDKVVLKDKKTCTFEAALSVISNSSFDVLLTLGAGNIDTLVKPLKAMKE